MKEPSLAALELLACLVSARIYESVRHELVEGVASVQFRTDSIVALYWITGDPNERFQSP